MRQEFEEQCAAYRESLGLTHVPGATVEMHEEESNSQSTSFAHPDSKLSSHQIRKRNQANMIRNRSNDSEM